MGSMLEKMKCHFTINVCKKNLKDNEFDRRKVSFKLLFLHYLFLAFTVGYWEATVVDVFFNDLAITIIGNGNRTEWNTIQGVIGRVIYALDRFEVTSTITPELYNTKSYYQLIVSITKCEKLTNEIFNASA